MSLRRHIQARSGAMLVVLTGLILAWGEARAFIVEPLEGGVVAVTMSLSGESEQAATSEAALQAVNACVGRVFWGEDLIIAEDLLTAYVEKNYMVFVRAIETLKKDFLAGKSQLTVRVFVDNRLLRKDLMEKRFIYTPRPRPYFKVFLAEKLGEQFATYSTGQEALTSALQDRNLQPFEGIIDRPPTNVDVAADPILSDDATVACERNGIELLISGTSVTTRNDRRDLYYDTYYFYTTEMKVKMIRVDTGEVLVESTARGTASHTEEERAIDLSIRRAAGRATNDLADYYDKVWGPMVLNHADYTVLLTGITPETLKLVQDALSGFSRDAKVYLRKKYDRSAVLNIVYPGKKEELLKAITTHPYPTLSLIPATEIDASLVGEAQIRLVGKTDITQTAPDITASVPRIYNYEFETRMALKVMDLESGKPVVEVSGAIKSTGLDPTDAALDCLRKSLGEALSNLNKDFPRDIEIVNLQSASYTVLMPREEKQLAATLAEKLRQETSLGKVSQSTERGMLAVRLVYSQPPAREKSLLGADPYLPDETLTAAARANFLEIQVGQ